MSFQIMSVAIKNKIVDFSRHVENAENVFTVITGKNGTGKSRLLSEIIRNYYAINSSSLYSSCFREFNFNAPKKIIAISTAKYDKYPIYLKRIKNIKKHMSSPVQYHYIGNNSVTPLANFYNLVEKIFFNPISIDFNNITHALEYLEFSPKLTLILTCDSRYKKVFDHTNNNPYGFIIDDVLDRNIKLNNNELNALKEFTSKNTFFKNKAIGIDFKLGTVNVYTHELDAYKIFLKLEYFKVHKVLLTHPIENNLDFLDLSSGQQAVLNIMLGISCFISDNCLICIDEPEISLHPEWQSEIVTKIQDGFSNSKGCHFVIATHSPQIVSGLTSQNGFVLSLEDDRLYHVDEYAKKSADFQLANIFQAPGYNNEYLIRISLVILSKISKQEILNDDDSNHIKLLKHIHPKIKDDDPVYYLIKQVLTLVK